MEAFAHGFFNLTVSFSRPSPSPPKGTHSHVLQRREIACRNVELTSASTAAIRLNPETFAVTEIRF